MQEVQRQTDLGRIEPRMLLGQPALPLHVEHQIAAAHKLNHEEQPRIGLEARVQPHQKRMIGRRLEHMLLGLHPVDVLVVRHQRLLDHLHRIDAARAAQLHHQHLRVAAAPDHADQLEIVERILPLRAAQLHRIVAAAAGPVAAGRTGASAALDGDRFTVRLRQILGRQLSVGGMVMLIASRAVDVRLFGGVRRGRCRAGGGRRSGGGRIADRLAVLVGARLLDELVAFLVDEQLAFGALEALPTEAPDAIVAVGAEGFLWSNCVSILVPENRLQT